MKHIYLPYFYLATFELVTFTFPYCSLISSSKYVVYPTFSKQLCNFTLTDFGWISWWAVNNVCRKVWVGKMMKKFEEERKRIGNLSKLSQLETCKVSLNNFSSILCRIIDDLRSYLLSHAYENIQIFISISDLDYCHN